MMLPNIEVVLMRCVPVIVFMFDNCPMPRISLAPAPPPKCSCAQTSCFGADDSYNPLQILLLFQRTMCH